MLSAHIAGVTKCMHRTAPGKMQDHADGNSRILPTYFVPNPRINSMWYSVFEMGRVGRVDEIVVYMYVESVG